MNARETRSAAGPQRAGLRASEHGDAAAWRWFVRADRGDDLRVIFCHGVASGDPLSERRRGASTRRRPRGRARGARLHTVGVPTEAVKSVEYRTRPVVARGTRSSPCRRGRPLGLRWRPPPNRAPRSACEPRTSMFVPCDSGCVDDRPGGRICGRRRDRRGRDRASASSRPADPRTAAQPGAPGRSAARATDRTTAVTTRCSAGTVRSTTWRSEARTRRTRSGVRSGRTEMRNRPLVRSSRRARRREVEPQTRTERWLPAATGLRWGKRPNSTKGAIAWLQREGMSCRREAASGAPGDLQTRVLGLDRRKKAETFDDGTGITGPSPARIL